MASIKLRHLLAGVGLVLGQLAFSQPVFINELLASNSGGLADEAGQHDDWLELFNAGAAPVDIAGFYLTDDLGQPTKWQVPANQPAMTTIPPGGFLLVWLDGEMAQGLLHANFKLSAGGEGLGLFAADGTPLDTLTFGPQTSNISYGRSTDGGGSFAFFTVPTPMASNEGAMGSNFAKAPTASVQGGFFSSNIEVELATQTPAATIRFTLDGSEPDGSSPIYATPLTVVQNTTLRARTFAPNHLPSAVSTWTYLMDAPHSFPVAALSFKGSDFFDPATGIYPNFTEDWERPVHVELFETDGMQGISQAATAEIHGTGSATNPQKSLKIKALSNNGNGYFQHPVFPNLPFEEYKNLLLRNGGQDWNITLLRDGFVASLAADLSDLGGSIDPPMLHLQGFRPGVAYLNGQYWGIHNLQEHMKADYISQHFGLSESEFDLLENDAEAVVGDFERWNEFIDFLNSHDFINPQHYEQLKLRLDMSHFLDYSIFNILVDNADWPGNNLRRWRQRNGNDARWRFLSFDFDFSFGLMKLDGNNQEFNTGDASANSLARALDDSSINWPNPWWTTLPLRKALQSPVFRQQFINRSADMLNMLLAPDRVQHRIDAFEAWYASEIQRHFDRWSQGWNPWADNMLLLRHFGNERPSFVRQHFVDYFDEIGGTANVQLTALPAGGGGIHLSTLHFRADKLPWSGTYFTGVEIPVEADPSPGFVFEKWSNAMLGQGKAANVTFNGDEVLTAIFQKGSMATDTIVINEINYHSANGGDWLELYNPNAQPVDISGWVLEDESGGYFSLPANTIMPSDGYLVLVENENDFASFYPQTLNRISSFGAGYHGFKFNNNGERIQLKNANLQVIDSVRYDNQQPWPLEADGQGASLQLIDWKLNNALPASWKAQPPTPGLPNQLALFPQTIDFQTIGTQFAYALPIVLQATASSGLPVSFTVMDGPATISANILTLTGLLGTVTVRASQQGGSEWQPATPVLQSFEVVELPNSDGGIFPPYILPNPVGNSLGVHFYALEESPLAMTVHATNGVELLAKKTHVTQGQHYVEMETASLSSGMYFLKMRLLGQRGYVLKFVKN